MYDLLINGQITVQLKTLIIKGCLIFGKFNSHILKDIQEGENFIGKYDIHTSISCKV